MGIRNLKMKRSDASVKEVRCMKFSIVGSVACYLEVLEEINVRCSVIEEKNVKKFT
jgi:hypothetical protein